MVRSLCHEIVFNRLHAVSGREGKSKNHWKMDVSPFSFSTLFSLIVQFFLPGTPPIIPPSSPRARAFPAERGRRAQ